MSYEQYEVSVSPYAEEAFYEEIEKLAKIKTLHRWGQQLQRSGMKSNMLTKGVPREQWKRYMPEEASLGDWARYYGGKGLKHVAKNPGTYLGGTALGLALLK